MAYTATVTKESVRQDPKRDYLYNVTIRMVVSDGQDDVFDQTASAKYNSNAGNLSAVKNALIDELKEKWDLYAAEHDLYTAAQFDTMISEIGTAAQTYVEG
jgi:hypothetical protein